MGRNLETELAFYRKYHFNTINVLIHVTCIPLIMFSAFALQSKWQVPPTFVAQVLPSLPLKYYPYANFGVFTALGYGLFYTSLDILYGFPTMLGIVFTTIKLTEYMRSHSDSTQKAIIIHVVAWLAQFIGHGVFERRAPALLDNLVQALVLAPFFVVFEVSHFLGIRAGILNRVDAIVLPEIEEFHAKKNK